MGIALVVDSLDGVAEEMRPLYKEADGKFRLDVEGIEDTSGLKSALEKEREAARKAAREAADLKKRYEGIDPDKVKMILTRFENDEEMKLLADGKFDQVMEKRTEKLRNELTKQIEEANSREKATVTRLQKYEQRVLDNHIRAAAAKAGIHTHAIEDALFRARTMFTLDDEGNAVQLGADGKPVLGKDGKTAFSPAEWLESMKEAAPHWFPAGSSGGGASGDKGGQGGGAKTMKRSAFEALTPAERMSFVRGGGKLTD